MLDILLQQILDLLTSKFTSIKTKLNTLNDNIGSCAAGELIERTITTYSNNNITDIGKNAFAYCDQLTSIRGDNVEIVWNSAFYGCSLLTTVNFPKLKTIYGTAFQNCSSLTNVSFPVLNTIQSNAFNNTGLSVITLGNDSMVTLQNINAFGGTAFDVTGSGGVLYVPEELISTYQANANWNTVLSQNVNNQILALPTT